MSELASRSAALRKRQASRTRSTFMVEALLLLAFVLILLAITVSLFAFASETSTNAQRMQEAADIAQNTAEEFISDPEAMPDAQTVGDYIVRCDIDREKTDAGVMYDARVTVIRGIEEVCTLSVSKYESAREGASVEGVQ